MSKPGFHTGFGYDVHALREGRELWLCGVKIDYPLGLDGHSDADVAIHALCDALLGAAALRDIGFHFPDTDPAYKGADSKKLLARVMQLIREKGWDLGNADITIIAQQPKIGPHIEDMRRVLAGVIGCPVEDISVKATTTEHLGFTGRMEGIASCASVLIISQQN